MKKIILLLLVFICFKLVSQERQVSFDVNDKINIIDATLERNLTLFPEYPGFIEARLYQMNDSVFTLEINHMPENHILRVSKVLNKEETLELRTLVTENISRKAPLSLLDQSGRTNLLVSTTIIGTYFYGTSVSTILSNDLSTNFLGTYLLTAGASFFIPYVITKNIEVTKAQAYGSFYGMSRGFAHGMLLPVLVTKEPDYKTALTLGIAGSITEGILGYHWAKKHQFSEGRSVTIGTYGDFGMGVALGAGYFLGLYEGNAQSNLVALSVLTGAAGGLYAGYRITEKETYSLGDAVALQGAGLLGAYLPASLLYVAGVEEPKLITLSATLGSLGGLYFGDLLAGKQEFSIRQGTYITLSQMSGTFIGMGLGYLIDSSDRTDFNQKGKTIALLTGIGSAAGYLLAIRNYSKDINQEDKNISLNLRLNPLGLLNTASGNAANIHLPVLVGSIRF